MKVTGMFVYEDESTKQLQIDSLSMRGAQREITGQLIDEGYEPVGRWQVESADQDGDPEETVRRFKLASSTVRIPEYLRTHPNSELPAITEAMGSSNPDSISSTLSELKKRGIVDNGVDGHSTREWIAVPYYRILSRWCFRHKHLRLDAWVGPRG